MQTKSMIVAAGLLALLLPMGFQLSATLAAQKTTGELDDAAIENLVKRSYQYVAMYNVNNKFALKQGGWNICDADTKLKDHTMREIARPNNDTLYISCLLDLRKDPVIIDIPAFDSEYVSLMITAYDHYVNVPMSSRLSDFRKPEKMLLYTNRTEGYDGNRVQGVDRVFEATGDFVSAVFRVMPHSGDAERFKRIVKQMQSVKIITLSEYRGGKAKPINDIKFPPVGKTDADVFENNLLEVMQFVFNHTTFDPNNELDQGVLAAYEPLGVVPGRRFEPNRVAKLDGPRFRKIVEQTAKVEMEKSTDKEFNDRNLVGLFLPKGQMTLERLLFQSVIGPIGLPAAEAMYPAIATMDGKPMNAMNDYVIRMSKEELPPAGAFWSFTLYDTKNGFFIPNDRKKYSVGKNGGMKLNEAGGIEMCVAAQKPENVPEENWLPINRKDENIDMVLRIYVPDLEKMKTWTPPKAEIMKATSGKMTTESGPTVEILKSWSGDFPVVELKSLPENQREKSVGFISDPKTFESIWKTFKPGEVVPEIDFKTQLVLFSRNTQFYNHLSIGRVTLNDGVAEVLAMETMSAAPIHDKVALSLAVVAKEGVSGVQSGDKVISVNNNR